MSSAGRAVAVVLMIAGITLFGVITPTIAASLWSRRPRRMWPAGRKVDDLVKALGVVAGISKSEVSRICAELVAEVAAFR